MYIDKANTKCLKEQKRFTLLLIPHSGKNIHSVEINTYLLLFFIALFFFLAMYVIYFGFISTNRYIEYQERVQTLKEQDEKIELLSQEIENARNLNKQFISELDKTSSLVDFDKRNDREDELFSGDFSQAVSISNQGNTGIDSTASLILLQQKISQSLPVLQKANAVLENQQDFLKEIPIYIPVKNANISMEWGPNIHPIFGYWYIHKGIDLAANPGTPIYAAADGVITLVSYDEGYGNHIFISHSFGFKTHYSHMKTTKVQKGEIVSQGQIIGTVGSTGIVTGPHLDFQIYLGSELIDPGRYMRYISDYIRPKGTR